MTDAEPSNKSSLHRTTGNWKRGIVLALVAAICWGLLPIALKVALEGLDPYTITWYRFATSALVLVLVLRAQGRLPELRSLVGRGWWLLFIALVGLTGNYVTYLLALSQATPTITQVVIQLAPLFFLIGGLALFKESFSRLQAVGVGVLVLGLALFFNHRLAELADMSQGIGLGFILLVLSALLWAAYGLAQKQLLRRLPSQQILLLIYAGAIVVLLPPSAPENVVRMTGVQLAMLIFSCANTLVAYGAFAESLEHWEASRIGAVLSLAPVFTLIGVRVVQAVAPGLAAPERLNTLSVIGALVVVAGSAMCALGKGADPYVPPAARRL